jgi:hypothetical protein
MQGAEASSSGRDMMMSVEQALGAMAVAVRSGRIDEVRLVVGVLVCNSAALINLCRAGLRWGRSV